jgi:hypothetical protein
VRDAGAAQDADLSDSVAVSPWVGFARLARAQRSNSLRIVSTNFSRLDLPQGPPGLSALPDRCDPQIGRVRDRVDHARAAFGAQRLGPEDRVLLVGDVRQQETTSRPSAARPRRCGMATGFRRLSSKSFVTSCGAAVWPAVSPAFDAPPAGWIDWSPSRARAAGSARAAAGDAWRSGRRIWSITFFPMCRYVNGS